MREHVLILAFSILVTLSAFAETIEKRPIPGSDKVKEAEGLVQELFKEDLASTDARMRMVLYAKLMRQVEENKTEPAFVYVLLRQSRDTALLAGNDPATITAHNRMLEEFEITPENLVADLEKLEASARSPEAVAVMVSVHLKSCNYLITQGSAALTERLAKRAEALTRQIKDPAALADAKAELARVEIVRKEAVAAEEASKRLVGKPEDPDANLIVGRFNLASGKFDKAFESLSKGSDEGLKKLAGMEILSPQVAAAQVAVADGWFDRAETETSSLKPRMRERAEYWYKLASEAATGLQKLKIESRMKALRAAAAEPIAPSKPIPPVAATPDSGKAEKGAMRAIIHVSGDDNYAMYVNGTKLSSGNKPTVINTTFKMNDIILVRVDNNKYEKGFTCVIYFPDQGKYLASHVNTWSSFTPFDDTRWYEPKGITNPVKAQKGDMNYVKLGDEVREDYQSIWPQTNYLLLRINGQGLLPMQKPAGK